jgi:adenylosuccinate synthase
MDGLEQRGIDTSGLVVSSRAHVVAPYHKAEDELREELLKAAATVEGDESMEIGTTRRGIGPAYADKAQRSTAVRMGDLLCPEVLRERVAAACEFKNSALGGMAARAGRVYQPFDSAAITEMLERCGQRLAPRIRDTTYLLHELLGSGKRLLFEGANANLLDVDHGTYPYVTASNCGALGIGPGTGVPERRLDRVLGVMKAYSTRVGRGPMPTELKDSTGDRIRERGREYGTTTGRPRRVGWVDLVAVKYSVMLNGVTGLVLTMLDVLDGVPTLRACTGYSVRGKETGRFLPDAHALGEAVPVYTELPGFTGDLSAVRKRADLPDAARRYADFLEAYLGVPLDLIGVGPGREQTIHS